MQRHLLPSLPIPDPHRAIMERVIQDALEAVDPTQAVLRHLHRVGDELVAGDQRYDLALYRQVFLVAIGKASLGMATAVAGLLDDRLTSGLVVIKNPSPGRGLPEQIRVLQGNHPVPGEGSQEAGHQALRLAQLAGKEDLILCAISGGGSALVTSPVEGVQLADLQMLTGQLLASGASIHEMNILRKHLDRIKGGGLLKTAYPAQVITLVLSDVIGNNFESIASGPTAPDPSSYLDAIQILRKYRLEKTAPPAVMAHLERGRRGEAPETLKPGDRELRYVQNLLAGSNRQAAEAALEAAKEAGLHGIVLTDALQGEARQAGLSLARTAWESSLQGKPVGRPACLIAGGETTVTLGGATGKGGRNQEVALSAVESLAGLEAGYLVTLGTDGEDGPTDAAGAIVSGVTLEQAYRSGLDPKDYLERHDSYTFFEKIEALLRPGPTGTNVNDLNFIFLF